MALPTGPVGLLSVRRALAYGCRAGFTSGIASSLADAPYIALARLGVTGFSRQLLAQRHWFSVVGFTIVVCIGAKLLISPRSATQEAPLCGESGKLRGEPGKQRGEYRKMFASAFLLTVSNPTILLSSAALFAAAGLPVTSGYAPILACVSASLVGSVLLWAALSFVLDRPHSTLTETALARLTRFAGLAIIGLAAVGLIAS